MTVPRNVETIPQTNTIISDCCIPRMTRENMSWPMLSWPNGWLPKLMPCPPSHCGMRLSVGAVPFSGSGTAS